MGKKDNETYKTCPNCGKLISWNAKVCPYCNFRYPKIDFQELRGGMTHPVISEGGSEGYHYKRPISIVLIVLLGILFLFMLTVFSISKTPLVALIICFPIFIIISFVLIFVNKGKNKIRMVSFSVSTCLMVIIFTISVIIFTINESKNVILNTPNQKINAIATKEDRSSNQQEVVNTSTTTVLETTTTYKATTTTIKDIFGVGELVDIQGTVITVTKFEKSKGSDFDKPREGMEYVIVSIEIVNNSNKKISYSPLDFKMQNSKGQINDIAFTIVDSDTALNSGELIPKGEVEGTIVFEEPINDLELTLIYQPNFWDEEVTKVMIK